MFWPITSSWLKWAYSGHIWVLVKSVPLLAIFGFWLKVCLLWPCLVLCWKCAYFGYIWFLVESVPTLAIFVLGWKCAYYLPCWVLGWKCASFGYVWFLVTVFFFGASLGLCQSVPLLAIFRSLFKVCLCSTLLNPVSVVELLVFGVGFCFCQKTFF